MITRFTLLTIALSTGLAVVAGCIADEANTDDADQAPGEDTAGATEASSVATPGPVPASAIGAVIFTGLCGTARATAGPGRVDLAFVGAKVSLVAGATSAQTTCLVKVPIAVPPGFVLRADPSTFAGSARLAPGVNGLATVRQSFAGEVGAAGLTQLAGGAFTALAGAGLTSRCGEPVEVKSSFLLRLSRQSGTAVASAEVTSGALVGLRFERCR